MRYHQRVIELNCLELSNRILDRVKDETKLFIEKENRRPCLCVILVGNNTASLSYVKSKAKKCDYVGFMHFQYSLSEDCLESEVLSLIDSLNEDDKVDGILVQLPLPPHIDKDRVINRISKDKDVDGFTPFSFGLLALGKPSFVPCTPQGILEILDNWNIETCGKKVCVIGRSDIVGKPTALLLMNKKYNATVTICNSNTQNLKEITLSSDIIIVAVGKANFIDSSFIKDGSVVIDVGINRIPDSSKKKGYRVVGDAAFDSFTNRDVLITPVPGGVGAMTVAELMVNTLKSAKMRKK